MAILTLICVAFSFAIYQFATLELRQGLHAQSERLLLQYPGFNFDDTLRLNRVYQEGSHRIFLNLLYFNIFILVLTGFFSYMLAKRTLQPIADAHEQQKRFTADVSHELRTPLTALKMSSEVALLDKSASKQELRSAIESNLEEGTKLEQLINNLLRLTRLEAYELQQTFTAVSVHQLVTEAVAEVTAAAKEKKITIDTEISEKDLSISGDHDSLVQLLVILLDNAVKYSEANSTVTITSTSTTDQVTLQVIDSGKGIDPKDLPHVFSRFYRANESRTSWEQGGYGLGLSIAKLIADIHKTVISLTSAPGAGTTASVSLARHTIETTKANTASSSPAK